MEIVAEYICLVRSHSISEFLRLKNEQSLRNSSHVHEKLFYEVTLCEVRVTGTKFRVLLYRAIISFWASRAPS